MNAQDVRHVVVTCQSCGLELCAEGTAPEALEAYVAACGARCEYCGAAHDVQRGAGFVPPRRVLRVVTSLPPT